MHWLRTAGVALAWSLALAWLFKLFEAWRGLSRIPNLLRAHFDRIPEGLPRIAVIVPARNEAPHIAACLRSLLVQDYQALRVIAVDDRSTDGTGDIMQSLPDPAGRLDILRIHALPEGWLGKPHAMAMGAKHAIRKFDPGYLLFTDADVIFAPDAVRRSLAEAVETRADHFVLMPTTLTKTPGEGLLLSYLQVMSLWAVRPWKVAAPEAKDAIGVGAFNMLRTDAYLRQGGFEAAPMEVLEDLMLGRRVKQARMRQRVATAPGMVSVHWAPGMMGIVRGLTKNAFAVFRFRVAFLIAASIAMAILCLGPVVLAWVPGGRIPAGISFVAVVGMYELSARTSRIPAVYALLFPFAAAITLYAMARSMIVTLVRGGIEWRGTFYSLADLRKHEAASRASDNTAAGG